MVQHHHGNHPKKKNTLATNHIGTYYKLLPGNHVLKNYKYLTIARRCPDNHPKHLSNIKEYLRNCIVTPCQPPKVLQQPHSNVKNHVKYLASAQCHPVATTQNTLTTA